MGFKYTSKHCYRYNKFFLPRQYKKMKKETVIYQFTANKLNLVYNRMLTYS